MSFDVSNGPPPDITAETHGQIVRGVVRTALVLGVLATAAPVLDFLVGFHLTMPGIPVWVLGLVSLVVSIAGLVATIRHQLPGRALVVAALVLGITGTAFSGGMAWLRLQVPTYDGVAYFFEDHGGAVSRSELVGEWAWSENAAWRYVFNADGTGTMGFDDAPIEWQLISANQILRVRGGAALAAPAMEWRIAISDDGVMALDSTTTNDAFRYYRIGN